MQALAKVSIDRPVFATMMTLALLVVGGAAFVSLGVDRLPSVDLPTIRVQTRLPGASPEEVEDQVTDLVEEVVNTVEGIDELRSISGPGSSVVIATFRLGRNIDTAAQDVRDKVATVVRRLPADAETPVVSKVDNDSDPVITIALAGDRAPRELTELADKVVKVRLERASGVGEVRISGGVERTMNVWLDADALLAHGLPVTAVRDALAAQNANVPGGNVTGPDDERSLRTMGRIEDAAGFEQLVVATIDGVPIRVGDLGRVEDGTAEQRTLARLNGKPTVTLEVVRQSGASTIEVIDGVKAALEAVAPQLPADVRLEVIRDQSRYIKAALHEINTHLVLGSVLASLVVLVFMRSWRSTFIACVAIPVSLVATFAVMRVFGFTMNSVTMLALVLMVGIVIDDAIVVLENIFRFVEEKGMEPRRAAVEATAEIGLAVLATTLSLVVIFVPVSFMSSVSGRFLYQFGLTAAAAILVSLFVSFSLTPMMASRLLRGGAPGHGHGDGARSRRGLYGVIDLAYTWLLRASLWAKPVVLLAIGGAIYALVPLAGVVKQEFTPADVDEAEFSVNVSAPEGINLAGMNEAMVEVERRILGTKGVRTALVTTGGGFLGQVNSGRVHVAIEPHEGRVWSVSRQWRALWAGDWRLAFAGNYKQADVMTEIEKRLKPISHLRCRVQNYQAFNIGGGPGDINFVIKGPVLEELERYGSLLRSRAMEAGGFRTLDTSIRLDRPELRVRIDRERAADLGVRVRDLGTALRLLVGGDDEVTRFRDPAAGEDYDVRLRLEPEDRDRPDLLGLLRLPRQGGGLVEVSAVASLSAGKAPSRVDRLDRQRLVSVNGGVAQGFALADRVAVLRQLAVELDMPVAYTTSLSGRSREMERTFREFLYAFALSMVFMYLILASQFESYVHPLVILLSIPLSAPFALASLWLVGGTLNLYSALGILVLFGVVKKNAILQIDHMNGLRAKGMPRREAVLRANRDRLRPILMTTFALVAGMLPLALGTGPGAEERQAVAVVVIGGQTLCLLLTLVATPVCYELVDDVAGLFRRRRGIADGASASGTVIAAVERGTTAGVEEAAPDEVLQTDEPAADEPERVVAGRAP